MHVNREIFVDGKLVGLEKMCNFSAVNLVFNNQVTRCKNLFYKLQIPIMKQESELAMFTDNMIALHSVKKVRNSRSIMSTSLQIAKALMAAANTVDSSILQHVIDTARKTSITLLHQLSSKISAAGITSKVVDW